MTNSLYGNGGNEHLVDKHQPMKTNYENTSLLDIVFENRNKAYGAYVLRRDYNKSLLQSALIASSFILTLLFGQFLKDRLTNSTPTYATAVRLY